MNTHRILLSLAVLVFAGGAVAGGTGAFFSDEETSTDNIFTAGALDLKVDSESHYNNMVCTDVGDNVYEWQPEENFEPPVGHYPAPGSECEGTWTETDLGPTNTFFSFSDLKPGDHGENTLSLHVYDNDAYACAIIDNLQDNDNGLTEPEGEDGDTTGGVGEGELSQYLHFFSWDDDGDNVWEDGETPLFSNTEGPASDILDGVSYPLYTPQTGVLAATTTEYIGLYWCFGDITVNEADTTLSCNGAGVNNVPQSDSMSADITFYVEQARNNEDFVCPEPEDGGGIGCTENADVMFVLDSSGSIDTDELLVVKNAADSFATALAPSTPGTHIGVVDFDGDATLNAHLTDVLADISTAIGALISGGTTNLADGILTASTELENPGDGDDRPDASSPDYMVIITDGNPDDLAAATAAADAAKAAGTTIYVVGVGEDVNEIYLESIATSAAHYFSSTEFSDLQAILDGIADCELPVAP